MFNKYPYTDDHELNLDWIIEKVKSLATDVTGAITDILAIKKVLPDKQGKLTAGENITITEDNVISASGGGSGKVDDVKVNGTSVVTDKVANVTVPTKTSDITNDSGFITSAYHDSTKQDLISSSNKLSASLISGLASVATSGSYNDLSNKPTIPTTTSQLTNDSGFPNVSVLTFTYPSTVNTDLVLSYPAGYTYDNCAIIYTGVFLYSRWYSDTALLGQASETRSDGVIVQVSGSDTRALSKSGKIILLKYS